MYPLLVAYSLSGLAGIRAPMTLLAVSVAVHSGTLHPGTSLEWLGSPGVMLVSSLFMVIDFLADKFPGLDHALHAVHVFVAPVVGALAAMSGHNGDLTAIGAILGGGTALAVHGVRAGTRAVVTPATLGMGNTFVSFAEDGIAVVLLILAFTLPLLVVLLLAFFVLTGVRMARRMIASRSASAA